MLSIAQKIQNLYNCIESHFYLDQLYPNFNRIHLSNEITAEIKQWHNTFGETGGGNTPSGNLVRKTVNLSRVPSDQSSISSYSSNDLTSQHSTIVAKHSVDSTIETGLEFIFISLISKRSEIEKLKNEKNLEQPDPELKVRSNIASGSSEPKISDEYHMVDVEVSIVMVRLLLELGS